MQEPQIFFAQEFYGQHLSTINTVHFTNREIDVIACLTHARGTGKIAVLLSIDKRTVETHIRNIMSKIDCNTREAVLDFVEGSSKVNFLRTYYIVLQNELLFEKNLKDIAKLNKEKAPRCSLIYEKDKDSFALKLKSHLEFVGIAISNGVREKKGDYSLFLLPETSKEEISSAFLNKITKSQNKVLLLQREKKNSNEIPQELLKYDIISFAKQENYFFSLFMILKKLLPLLDLEKIIGDFKDKYKKGSAGDSLRQTSPEVVREKIPFVRQRWAYVVSACALISLFGTGFFVFYDNSNDKSSIRADLNVPTESSLLNRPELMNQIETSFRKQNNGIKTVAIVGIGGAGKTTLAREYARQQKEKVVWEINGETHTGLTESFGNLAYALATTEEDKGTLRDLTEIKNPSERERRIIDFVKVRLKLHPNWFLIYDNVEKFADIQKYYPQDSETWGQGRVILTTRNYNIQNNKSIKQMIQIGELNEDQKLHLFTTIITHGENGKLSTPQKEEIIDFLKQIPPFPLDVSVAAYYLKVTNIPYKKYLENLKVYHRDFAIVQENLLKEAGAYVKTRYGIITSSLEHLIKNHKDFKDLLLFISLLNSQNIPRDLLNTYKSGIVVDNFIYHLKKYSLITNDSSASESTFSIHRSTQAITLAHLIKILNLQENANNISIQPVAKALTKYVEEILDKDDLLQEKHLISQLEMFLSHENFLSDSTRGLIETELGCIYSSLGLVIEATHHFEIALLKLRKNEKENYEKIAQSLLFQGNAYRMQSDFKKAEGALKESIYIYKKHMPTNLSKIALGLVYLGNVYRWTGEYEKAKSLFQESLLPYEKLPPQTSMGKVMALAYLGDTYRRLGDYKKAMASTEESLKFCRKYFPKNSVRPAWSLMFLGMIHRDLGNYEMALDLLNQGLEVNEKSFSRTNVNVSFNLLELAKVYCNLADYKKAITFAEEAILLFKNVSVTNFNLYCMDGLGCIGNAYKGLENYKKAKTYLEKNLKFCDNHYGKNHLETAYVLESLGQLYLLESNLKMAEEFLDKALNILQKNNHPSAYKCFESFSDLYLKKSLEAANNHATEDIQNFKTQAINDLKKALEIVTTHFPADSPHIKRIQMKIQKLEQGDKLR